ncbi:hypothetical protein GETHPA_04620 [Geothrix rubra]|uniref:Uncharacterized protein n=1 Tax=Geothrix rubra TaxID=2927977 RepID=A0ABQ5Q352_9BACT|nr:hypothetical protein [Geothrix rubra]GLH68929.1 hypothetical protein GETHPA_04620 [Geothrix rubra]
MSRPDPVEALHRLQAFVRPESRRPPILVEDWQPPAFGSYEELKAWLKEAVLTARVYEAFPDGRWTIELLLKEQEPGTTYRIRL